MAHLVPHAGGLPPLRLNLERGKEGYIVGAQMFNLIAAELLFVAIFIGVLVATLPGAPWDVLLYGGLALMILFPVFFYRSPRPSSSRLTSSFARLPARISFDHSPRCPS